MAADSKKLVVSLFSVLLFVLFIGAVRRIHEDEALKSRSNLKMEKLFASAKKEVLVEIVKLAQKRGMVGSKGGWKEFLKIHDKKFGASLGDPSRRSVNDLVAFLNTFEQDDDLKFFKKVLKCHSNRDDVEQLKNNSLDEETAEQKLVRLTLEHPQYPVDYSFPSHKEEWSIVDHSKKKSNGMKSTDMIAVDCEMVLCEDGTEALVKVCAVDRNLEVKLDKVVNPNKEIVDYRTEITGISAKDLDGVTYTLREAQKSMKKLLSHGTILVGHSLNNDLQALMLDYTRVIDTSYVFKHPNGSNRKPSLCLLCKSLLGYELRTGSLHNCLDDARAAMKLVLARLDGKIGDVIAEEAKESDMARLLIHRIPINFPSKDLKSVLPGNFGIEVKSKKRTTYSAFAIFNTQQEAIKAFGNIDGELEKDSCGRAQKLVKFELDSGITGDFCVCKIVADDSIKHLTKKRPAEDDAPGVVKKLKTDETLGQLDDSSKCSDHCDTHLKKIGRLEEELSQREKEISSLNKIIAALARKQGL